MTQENQLQVVLYGPEPEDAERTGGVATHVQHLSSRLDSTAIAFRRLYLDSPLTRPFPGIVRRAVDSVRCAVRLLRSRLEPGTVLHVNTSLYPHVVWRDLLVVVAGVVRGVPVLVQVHGGRWSTLRDRPVSRWLWAWIFRHSDVVGAFPGPQMEELQHRGLEERLVPLRTMVPRTSGRTISASEETHFLFLGALTKAKGAHRIVEAYARLKAETGRAPSLTICGEGPLRDWIRHRVREEDVADTVELPGYLTGPRLDAVMNEANVLLLPSDREGLPFAFLECAERGMATVVTTDSAIPSLFEEGKEFLPYRPDDPRTLYSHMQKLACDPGLREHVGRAGQRAVHRCCTIEAAMPLYDRVYRSLSRDHSSSL